VSEENLEVASVYQDLQFYETLTSDS